MSNRRVYLDYVRDMLENANKALHFVGEMDFEEFSNDEKTVYAVVRAIEVIGEAARNAPDELRTTYSEIPWRVIVGTRDKLIHDYFGINLKVVWRTVQEDLPILVKQLSAIINDYAN